MTGTDKWAPRAFVDVLVAQQCVLTDAERGHLYRLVIHLLAGPPGAADLQSVAALVGDGTSLGAAVHRLANAAESTGPEALSRQYHRLFVGLGGGEFSPYASHYMHGTLHDRPLVDLRQDMRKLGIRRIKGAAEPEDHIVTVLEVMLGLVERRFGGEASAAPRFFYRHIDTWVPRFMLGLESAADAQFYSAVGAVGGAFLASERQHF